MQQLDMREFGAEVTPEVRLIPAVRLVVVTTFDGKNIVQAVNKPVKTPVWGR